MTWIVGLLSPEGWGVLVGALLGALFGAVGSVIVITWQRRSEDDAKRTALIELLAVEHARSEDSIGELGETQLYLPIALSAPEQLLSRGLLRYDHAKHRPLLLALMHLERAVAVFNQLANASNVASVYPALGANKHSLLNPAVDRATRDLVGAWGEVEIAVRAIDATLFGRALGKE